MLNQLVVVGRVKKVELYEEKNDDGKARNFIELKVPRHFKNEMGEYEADYIRVETLGLAMRETLGMIKTGDLLGIKGRVMSEPDSKIMHVVAEKITLLKSANE